MTQSIELTTEAVKQSIGRRLLYIAFHFPPLQGSTGIARTLAFARYLSEWHWDVTVLTVKPSTYAEIRQENYASIPTHVNVVRASAFDASRDLSIFGRYPTLLATPDKYQSWIFFGVLKGMKLIRSWRPDAIVSTYPIASAHSIGYRLHKISGLPWIADFRDPMAQPGYPADPRLYRAFEQIEKLAFTHAARVLVTTPGAAELYAKRFPDYPRENLITVSNGFDPEMFATTPTARPGRAAAQSGPLKLLHSGLVYPEERDPFPLFDAIARLQNAGYLSPETVNFVFRASGNAERYAPRVRELGLEKTVLFAPPIPYREAVAEMVAADGLLILQASNCNDQIPAKLYEYLYAARPILCLTDPDGDTGQLLQKLGSKNIARLDKADDIGKALVAFIDALKRNEGFIVPPDRVANFSRRKLTGDLAAILDDVTSTRANNGFRAQAH